MNHKISKKLKALVLASMASVIGLGITGCDDEIDKSNRFTFKAELISTHLQNNPDKFSSFTSILSKAKRGNKSSGSILKTLSTYGSYTCFAPTNEAIDAFLAQEYEKYLNGENTGITDPSIEFLSDSMATVIAKNHIIEMGYKTIDISSGAFPGNTMSGRFTTVFWNNDEVTGQVYIMLNNSARIIAQDLEMENGYIQVIDGVLNPSNKLLPELIGSHNSFSLFHEAIMLTGLDALLSQFEIDPEYDGTAESTARLASESNSKAPYPKYNNKRFTVLVEPDELYKSLGYETIDDIIALANKWYTTTKTGAPITDEIRNDYTHRDNPLNQYVAYHIIDRQLKYSSSTSPGGFIMENYVNEGYSSLVNLNQSFDSYEYYETMMPNTMIKVTKPYTNTELRNEIVLNYAQEMGTVARNPEMRNHMNVIVEKFENTITKYPGLANFDQGARNGIIHVIDRILIYNEEEMHGNVLNERMRFDFGTLLPELTTNNVRYAPWPNAGTLCGHGEYEIPDGYAKNLKILNGDTHVFYTSPYTWGCNYLGDEFLAIGKYDFAYKLPPVPAGTYELRVGYTANGMRSITQFYVDNKICGIPVDLRIGATDARIGYKADVADDTENEENDRVMRNHGYMKAGNSFTSQWQSGDGKKTARSYSNAIRKIITTMRFEGEHWIRIKKVDDIPNSQMNHDYIEIVPTSIVNSYIPEDRL